MGFLYPWSRIRDQHIPRLEAFEAYGRGLVEAMRRHSGVRAASIYGSVARGDHTVRSDLDFVVVCERDALRHVRATMRTFKAKALELHLIVSPYVVTVDECLSGRTRFGPSFRETFRHLAETSSSTFGDLHTLITPNDSDVTGEMRRKLALHMRNLFRAHEAFVAIKDLRDPQIFDEWSEGTLQSNHRLLHVYMGFARWMLYWQNGSIRDDSKQAVIEAFLREPAFQLLHEPFMALRKIDADYDNLLERTQKGIIARRVYILSVLDLTKRAFKLCAMLFAIATAITGIRQPQAFHRQAERMAA